MNTMELLCSRRSIRSYTGEGISGEELNQIMKAANAVSSELIKELHLPEDFIPCWAVALGKTEETYELKNIPEDRISKNTIE